MSVKAKQNEPQILKEQYSARHCYNGAQLFFVLSWLCCIAITILAIFFENKNVELCAYIIAILTVFEFLFERINQWYIKFGSAYRMKIDDYLFGWDYQEYYCDISVDFLTAFSNIIARLHKKRYLKQIRNTENDKPRGVKDWYRLEAGMTKEDEIKSCQSENIKFDKIISTVHIYFVITLAICFFAILLKVDNKGLMFCSFVSVTIKIISYVIDIYQYIKCKNKRDCVLAQIQNSTYDLKLVKKLQEVINHRRQLSMVPFSIIHYFVNKFQSHSEN